jgi:hypothetical protein
MSTQEQKEPEGMATDAPVWVSIGEFRVVGVGQLRAYLPESSEQTGAPDPSADSARYSIVHPVSQAGIAVVTGLDTEQPVWEHAPDEWTLEQRTEAVDKMLQLRRSQRARSSHATGAGT